MSHGEVIIETAEPVAPAVIAEIKKMPAITFQSQNGRILTLAVGKNEDVSSIVTLLATRGVRIEQVKKQEATLEEMYTTILKEAEQK
jgi:hypothetical protein